MFIKQDYNAYESSNYPGYFIRHQNYRLKIDKDDGSDLFKKDASFFKESSEFIYLCFLFVLFYYITNELDIRLFSIIKNSLLNHNAKIKTYKELKL